MHWVCTLPLRAGRTARCWTQSRHTTRLLTPEQQKSYHTLIKVLSIQMFWLGPFLLAPSIADLNCEGCGRHTDRARKNQADKDLGHMLVAVCPLRLVIWWLRGGEGRDACSSMG